MRAPLSIVIPTLNAEQSLTITLEALFEGLHAGLIRELVISDGGSTDGTLAVAAASGARIVHGPPSRGGQLRRGADAAAGDWLLFLHADTVLSPGWSVSVRSAMARHGAYHFRLRFDETGPAPALVAAWANLRSALFRLPYGDQGLLIDRSSYLAVGGYPDIPLMEDVALIRALPRSKAIPLDAITSARRYRDQGWLRRGFRNLGTLALYFAGRDPETLARRYRR